MTGSILTYLDHLGQKTMEEMPFNDVDALILCQLAYLKYDGQVPDVDEDLPPIGLEKLAASPRMELLFTDERFGRMNRELFLRVIKSRRFRGIRAGAYVNLIEKDWETQFAAITLYLGENVRFVAFRGTDEHVVGWKEDFNMAILYPIPAQHCALKYVRVMAERIDCPFYLGGHSKGGNLAIYAAMHAQPQIQAKIIKTYNMDGPGFRPEVLELDAYDRIEDRVVKILPHSSIIGMLFEQDTRRIVVESAGLGLWQHDPYSWMVEEDHFLEAKGIGEGRQFLNETLREWMESLTEEEIRTLRDALFGILEASKARDLIELGHDKKKSMTGMLEAARELEPETVNMIKEALGRLCEVTGERALRKIGTWKK